MCAICSSILLVTWTTNAFTMMNPLMYTTIRPYEFKGYFTGGRWYASCEWDLFETICWAIAESPVQLLHTMTTMFWLAKLSSELSIDIFDSLIAEPWDITTLWAKSGCWNDSWCRVESPVSDRNPPRCFILQTGSWRRGDPSVCSECPSTRSILVIYSAINTN